MAYKKKTQKELQEESKELQQRIELMIKNFRQDKNALVDFLKFQSNLNLYEYSARNRCLLYNQIKDSALLVGTYKKWQSLGYHVKSGEKAHAIVIPRIVQYYTDKNGDQQKVSKTTPKPILDGIKKRTIPTIQKTYFQVSHSIFNITQTNCPPEEYSQLLSPGYSDLEQEILVNALVRFSEEILHCPVEKNLLGVDLRGYYGESILSKKEIGLNSALKTTQLLSTFTHELGHAIQNLPAYANQPNKNKSLSQTELEADCFSYILDTRLGIEPTDARIEHLQHHYIEYLSEYDAAIQSQTGQKEKPDFLSLLTYVDKLADAYWEDIERLILDEQTRYEGITKHIKEIYASASADFLYSKEYYLPLCRKNLTFDNLNQQFEETIELAQDRAENMSNDIYAQIIVLQASPAAHDIQFRSMSEIEEPLSSNMYEIVYREPVKDNLKERFQQAAPEYLERLFLRFQFANETPSDISYWGHSLSVSDVVIAQTAKGEYQCYFCDRAGFVKLDDSFLTPETIRRIQTGTTIKEEFDMLTQIKNSSLIHDMELDEKDRLAFLDGEYPYLQENSPEEHYQEILTPEAAPETVYTYFATKPIQTGSYPSENIIEISENKTRTRDESIGIDTYGTVTYRLPLSRKEIDRFGFVQRPEQETFVFREAIHTLCIEYSHILSEYNSLPEERNFQELSEESLLINKKEILQSVENMKLQLYTISNDNNFQNEEYKTIAKNLYNQLADWEQTGLFPFIDVTGELNKLFETGHISKEIKSLFDENILLYEQLKNTLRSGSYETDTFVDAVSYVLSQNPQYASSIATKQGCLIMTAAVPEQTISDNPIPKEFEIDNELWRVIDERVYTDEKLYLIHHHSKGETYPAMIVTETGTIRLENVTNGWQDYETFLAEGIAPIEPEKETSLEKGENIFYQLEIPSGDRMVYHSIPDMFDAYCEHPDSSVYLCYQNDFEFSQVSENILIIKDDVFDCLAIRKNSISEKEPVLCEIEQLTKHISNAEELSSLQVKDISLPYVKILWSELGGYSELNDNAIMSLKEAELFFQKIEFQYEEERGRGEEFGYYKTKFQLVLPNSEQPIPYVGRFDIGSDSEGLISHIRDTQLDFLEYDRKTGHCSEIEYEKQVKEINLFVKDLWNDFDRQFAEEYQMKANELESEIQNIKSDNPEGLEKMLEKQNFYLKEAKTRYENIEGRNLVFEKTGRAEEFDTKLSQVAENERVSYSQRKADRTKNFLQNNSLSGSSHSNQIKDALTTSNSSSIKLE